MVRPASIDRNGIIRGAWSEEEDNKLRACINRFGHPNWRLLPRVAGLKRCGKSCRLRWMNYLKPGLRRGNFTKDEEALIIQLHKQLGNKWSAIAAYFDGRTDNDIKNYWHAHIQKRSKRAIKIQNLPQEEQSFDNNSCITTSGLNQEEPAASEVVFNQGNFGVLESNADSDYNAAGHLYQNSDHHNFFEEELCQDDIMSKLFDYSDNGIASWNFSAAKSQEDFWTEPVGEEFFNIKLW